MSNDNPISSPSGSIIGARPREQSVTSDWTVLQDLIDGVCLKEIRSVLKGNGYLTEIYRSAWKLDDNPVDQVFQVSINPGEIEAWHIHARTTDRFFVSSGRVRIVLYDDRDGSATKGMINEFRLGTERPGIISVPPGIWHGMQNIGNSMAIVINLVDTAYVYEAPDHWGLPSDTDQIPFQF